MLEPIPFAGYVEIDEAAAWTDGKGNYFDKTSFFPVHDLIPLYTHPAKEQELLAEIEMLKKLLNDFGITVTKKAQEK